MLLKRYLRDATVLLTYLDPWHAETPPPRPHRDRKWAVSEDRPPAEGHPVETGVRWIIYNTIDRRTLTISFRPEMISRRGSWTLAVATYLDASKFVLPTSAANEGLSCAPGGGCMTSAPECGWGKSKQGNHCNCWAEYQDYLPMTTLNAAGSEKTGLAFNFILTPPSLPLIL